MISAESPRTPFTPDKTQQAGLDRHKQTAEQGLSCQREPNSYQLSRRGETKQY